MSRCIRIDLVVGLALVMACSVAFLSCKGSPEQVAYPRPQPARPRVETAWRSTPPASAEPTKQEAKRSPRDTAIEEPGPSETIPVGQDLKDSAEQAAKQAEEASGQAASHREVAELAEAEARRAAAQSQAAIEAKDISAARDAAGKASEAASRARQAASRAATAAQRASAAHQAAKRTLEKPDENRVAATPSAQEPRDRPTRVLDRLLKEDPKTVRKLVGEAEAFADLAHENSRAALDHAEKAAKWAEEATASLERAGGGESTAKQRPDAARTGIDPGEIPEVPKPPPRAAEPRPAGVVPPSKEPEKKKVEILGEWLQVSAGNAPDFLPGGYEESRLAFRADGILEVRRTFGKRVEFSQTWRISYDWNKDRTELLLGQDPNLRPSAASLRGFVDEGQGIVVKPPVQDLPVALPCVNLPDGRVQIGGKTYANLAKRPTSSSQDD